MTVAPHFITSLEGLGQKLPKIAGDVILRPLRVTSRAINGNKPSVILAPEGYQLIIDSVVFDDNLMLLEIDPFYLLAGLVGIEEVS